MHPRTLACRAAVRTRLIAAFSLLLLAAAALAGCGRGADSGATANPVAPGRPGPGGPAVEVAPVPGSINESPGVGGSGGRIAEGITGSGAPTDTPTQTMGSGPPPRPRGVGLDGGLGPQQPPGAGAAPVTGSPNATSGNAVGQR